jgi:hypothetical protein
MSTHGKISAPRFDMFADQLTRVTGIARCSTTAITISSRIIEPVVEAARVAALKAFPQSRAHGVECVGEVAHQRLEDPELGAEEDHDAD